MAKATRKRIERHHGVDIPTVDQVVYTDDPRGWAVAKMRELADRLASGELHGARSEWRDQAEGPPSAFVMVEAFKGPTVLNGQTKRWAVRLTRVTFRPAAEAPKPTLAVVAAKGG